MAFDDPFYIQGCEVVSQDAIDKRRLERNVQSGQCVEMAFCDAAGRVLSGKALHFRVEVEDRKKFGDFTL
ncbi:MAG: hypothetical protein H8E44_03065 [Planctomycetes bacterium]|nr:hypothetical protein [Planctomycetota bacterium]